MNFDAISKKPGLLYRGINGEVEREIFSLVGLGPIYRTAKRAVQERIKLSQNAYAVLIERLQRHGKTSNVSFLPPDLALERTFEALTDLASTHFTANDHILSEAPIQNPPTGCTVESLTYDPRTAVYYAYGILPDHAANLKPNDAGAFYRGKPNEKAAIAVIDVAKAELIEQLASVAVAGTHEVRRRQERDQETLLNNLIRVEAFVDLPGFDMSDPRASLNAAAQHLFREGVIG